MTAGYHAVVRPLPSGGWKVEVWQGRASFSDVARDLVLDSHDVAKIVGSEKRARRVAARMIARCEKRHAAKYGRTAFVVRPEETP